MEWELVKGSDGEVGVKKGGGMEGRHIGIQRSRGSMDHTSTFLPARGE